MFAQSAVQSVFITDMIGIMLSVILMLTNMYRFRRGDAESKILFAMLGANIVGSVLRILVFTFDRVPGQFAYWVLLGSETILYVIYMVLSVLWYKFFALHLNYESKTLERIIQVLCFGGIIGLLLATPYDIIFTIGADNHFERQPFFEFYYFLMIFTELLSLGMYLWVSRKRAFKFFPVGVYCLPVILGEVIKMFDHDTSIVFTMLAVSLTGIFCGLKNEEIYRDNLTGVFNRTYLKYLANTLEQKPGKRLIGIMIDLNDFKKINDNFGHLVGDDALINAAKIIRKAVSWENGTVIRFAGDEFIVFFVTDTMDTVIKCERMIQNKIECFNKNSKKPYKLSLSMGHNVYDPERETFDEFIDTMDKEMYKAKEAYYSNTKHDRRAR